MIDGKKYDMEVKLELEKYRTHSYKELLESTASFIESIDVAYGFYIDSMNGFNYVCKMTPESEKMSYFGNGDPRQGRIKLHHSATQSQVKHRNSSSGFNRKRAFQMLVIWIYMLWDTKYRKSIASALCVNVKDVNSDIMGAIRYLRNHIAHCKGIIPSKNHGLKVIKKVSLFNHLRIGDEIVFSDEDECVYEIIRYVKRAMDEIVIAASGKDPEYRKVWYLE